MYTIAFAINGLKCQEANQDCNAYGGPFFFELWGLTLQNPKDLCEVAESASLDVL